jgi:hypothetical protein
LAAKPVFVTLTLYSPVRDKAANVAEPWLPDIASRLAWVAVFVMVMVAPGTTASFWSTTVTVNAPVFGDWANAATEISKITTLEIDAETIDRPTRVRTPGKGSAASVLKGLIIVKNFLSLKSKGKDKRQNELLPALVEARQYLSFSLK